MKDIYLSIIVPVYNEERNIKPLAGEITKTINSDYEIIWINDGSTDNSLEILKELASAGSRHKIISFARNFGQTAAISAGIKHSCGKFITLLDGDGQNDPSDIIKMLAETENCDIVSGWRKNRKDKWLSRILPSKIANWLISKITGVRLHDYGCTLKIYRSEFLKNIGLYGEMHRFLPALAANLGAKICEVEVNHRARKYGKSKYDLVRTFKVLLDLITVKFMGRYLSKPIYVFGGFGFVLFFLSVILAAITLYNKYSGGVFVKDQPLFLVAIFLALIAMQLIMLGIISEIIVRIYYDNKNHPSYFVKEKIGL